MGPKIPAGALSGESRNWNAPATSDQSASGLAQRLVDEGLRMAAHPGVVFRSGPAGRRAALVRGPDMWEVVALTRRLSVRSEEAVTEAAAWLGLSEGEVRSALAYYGEFPAEADRVKPLHDRLR